MERGITYVFDPSDDVSNSGHPLRFYLDLDKSIPYSHTEEIMYPSSNFDTGVVGPVIFSVGPLTPRTRALNMIENTLSFQSTSDIRMGGIVSIINAATDATTATSSSTTTTTTTTTTMLSTLALQAAFASAPSSIGTPTTAVKQNLQICQSYMGTSVNTCLCYESNPTGTSNARSGGASIPSSSSAAIRLCAAECSASTSNDGFSGTKR